MLPHGPWAAMCPWDHCWGWGPPERDLGFPWNSSTAGIHYTRNRLRCAGAGNNRLRCAGFVKQEHQLLMCWKQEDHGRVCATLIGTDISSKT